MNQQSSFSQTPVDQIRPAGIKDGINYQANGNVILSLFAPFKNTVHVIGDFNNWNVSDEYLLKRDIVSDDKVYWWIELNGLNENEEYAFQYLVNGNLRIADPYTEKILDPNADQYISNETYPNLKAYPSGQSEIVSILYPKYADYDFQYTENFNRPDKEKLTIYEICIRDFVEQHSFQALLDKLPHLKEIGVNAIELMPISEFDNNSSWGYNPTFYFAVDKYYGQARDLKRFIDECHKQGIAVITDLVLNHSYDPSPLVRLYQEDGKPANNNPWYNRDCVSNHCWENDFNHTSEATQYFVDRVTKYWLSEYKFDGIRFDFTQGFTQKAGNNWFYDTQRIAIIKRMADEVWKTDANAYVILEHWTENKEEKELADYGCMLWGNATEAFHHAGIGDIQNSNFSHHFYGVDSRRWNDPHLITYMESHDEERTMYKNLQNGYSNENYNIKDLPVALKRSELCAAFLFTTPGPKMMWQFQELGYDYSINYNGRVGEKPIRWDYKLEPDRKKLFDQYSEIIKLRLNHEVFTSSETTVTLNLSDPNGLKQMILTHPSMKALIIGNFDIGSIQASYAIPRSETWYSYFDNGIIMNNDEELILNPGEYKIFTNKKISRDQLHTLMNVTGSFANWDLEAHSMIYENDVWKVTGVQLDEGNHSLKFANSFDWSGSDWGNNIGLSGIANNTTGGGNNITFTISSSGSYTILFNEKTLEYSIVKEILTEIDEVKTGLNQLQVYPNPSHNQSLYLANPGRLKIEKIEFLNIYNQRVGQQFIRSSSESIKMNNLPSDVKIIHILSEKGDAHLKVIRE